MLRCVVRRQHGPKVVRHTDRVGQQVFHRQLPICLHYLVLVAAIAKHLRGMEKRGRDAHIYFCHVLPRAVFSYIWARPSEPRNGALCPNIREGLARAGVKNLQ